MFQVSTQPPAVIPQLCPAPEYSVSNEPSNPVVTTVGGGGGRGGGGAGGGCGDVNTLTPSQKLPAGHAEHTMFCDAVHALDTYCDGVPHDAEHAVAVAPLQ